jgi:hypothetical protein
MYKYMEASFEENKEFFDCYVNSLSARYDDFLEGYILRSKVYSIYVEDAHCGYFAICDNTMLTQFFMIKSETKHTQPIFADILSTYAIKNAFVPTCDEYFLVLCMDKHVKVNIQAYFFEETDRKVRPAKYSREMLKLATLDDLTEIKEITGDFVDKHEDRIRNKELYILRDGKEFLGMGIIFDNIIMKNCKATGMFTNEKYRQKEVGRSIILLLRDMCHEVGAIPLPGCWYYNYNSKRTLESCGYISKTRLLRIDFVSELQIK